MDKLAVYQSTLTHALQVQIDRQQNCLNQFRLKLRFLSPINQIQQKRTYCMDLEEKLTGLMENALMQQKHRMALYAEQLKGLSPLDKLSQGYAYVEDMQHKVVNDMRRMKIGDSVCIYVRNGMIQAEITKTQEGCLEKEVEEDCKFCRRRRSWGPQIRHKIRNCHVCLMSYCRYYSLPAIALVFLSVWKKGKWLWLAVQLMSTKETADINCMQNRLRLMVQAYYMKSLTT